MRIVDLISGIKTPFFSLEFFPPSDEEQLPAFFNTVEQLRDIAPLFASVTYGAGGKRQHNTLGIAKGLVERGLTCMPHLTCIGAMPESISQFLQELHDVGIENVLALRGDPPVGQPRPEGAYFKYASDLVAFIRSRDLDMCVGVAAYPAPHPESATFIEDRENTARKISTGADFAITQLFFDVREYEDLLVNLRSRNLNIPVIPGILPIQSFDSLRRVLSMCGANIPGKLYLDLEKAMQQGGEQALREVGLNFAVQQIHRLLDVGAPGIHLYTLNRSELCLRIAEETKSVMG